jgi:HD-GYP domain-containing protein (c-di-GMP phosphodiesterase class II)
VLGALTIYSPESNGFSEEEIRLLGELADDLAFGIITLRTRKLAEQSAERLLRSVEGTIAAMAAIVELRDPYTAGHQRRVAELCKAIAHEMQLPDEDAHGIYVAAVIHDLGKIRVPAEILSKPAQLSHIEFQLIQTHPQAGYDILKEIDFPWPIAQMVYQHHERLDGTGYPNGLKDAELLPGAKILAVADTVEAMASHRPYRPALGLEAALDEIMHLRGVRYDANVVDACVRLFRERGYRLPA